MKGSSKIGVEPRTSSFSPADVCVTLQSSMPEEMAAEADEALASGADLVELRVDLLRKTSFEIIKGELSHFMDKAVVTVRRRREGGGFIGNEKERINLIRKLLTLSPRFSDVELETIERAPQLLRERPERTQLIVSWHNLSGTPGILTLRSIMERSSGLGITKIVTKAQSYEDNIRVLSLYRHGRKGLIAFCTGRLGMVSRFISMQLGSPIIYASLQKREKRYEQPSLWFALSIRRLLSNCR